MLFEMMEVIRHDGQNRRKRSADILADAPRPKGMAPPGFGSYGAGKLCVWAALVMALSVSVSVPLALMSFR